MTGIELITKERQRQIEVEGWTPEHDAKHDECELAWAAVTYALPKSVTNVSRHDDSVFISLKRLFFWPFEIFWFKPTDRITDLVKAGALIAAEIDRIQNIKG